MVDDDDKQQIMKILTKKIATLWITYMKTAATFQLDLMDLFLNLLEKKKTPFVL